MSVAFVLVGAASLLGPTSVAHAQENSACRTAASTWTRQETWVWRQLCLRRTADLDSRGRFGDRGDPTATKGWSGSRVLSSRFLETILTDEEYSRHLSNHPVEISGAWFQEDLTFAENGFPFSMSFSNSRFDRSIDLHSARIDGNIGFFASAIHGALNMNRLTVSGSVFLHGNGSFQYIDLISADIGSDFVGETSTFHKELDLNSAKIAGEVFLRNNASFQQVDLLGANIGGSVDADASTFHKELDLNSTDIAQHVFLRNNASFQNVDLVGADIGGSVEADGSTFHDQLDLNSANVARHVFMKNNASFQEVDLIATEVGGNVEASTSTFHKRLDLNSANIEGHIFLNNGASFQDVDLGDADIGGKVIADGSTFHKSLSLSYANIGGSISFLDNASFQDVELVSADIDGDIEAVQAKFNSKLTIRNTDVGGAAILGPDCSFGDVELTGSSIGRLLRLSGSDFAGYVDVSNDEVMGILELGSGGGSARWKTDSTLDLRATSVVGVDDDVSAWPQHLYLTGFTYKLPSGYATRAGRSLADRDLTWYRRWLESDESYSRQPYRQVEAILRSVGRDRDADVIAMKSKDRQYHEQNPLLQAAGGLHKWTVGYGYRPEWIIYWALAFTLVGSIIANRLPRSVTRNLASRLILSAQLLIPLINFGKTYAEAEVTSLAVRPRVRRYFYFHSFMGYLLAGLLVAALARITATGSV